MDQTPGQRLVRASFNPSEDSDVDNVKAEFASIADILFSFQDKEIGNPYSTREKVRLLDNALGCVEMASMYAVKYLTTDKSQ